MKALVTGGAGFIGQHVVSELLSRGHSVRVLDSLRPDVHADQGWKPPDGVEFTIGDVRDGTTYTMMCGERKTITTTSPPIMGAWLGAPPGGVESIGRVLGASDQPPNDPQQHFEAYSSYHSGGINIMLVDGSVQFVSDNMGRAEPAGEPRPFAAKLMPGMSVRTIAPELGRGRVRAV